MMNNYFKQIIKDYYKLLREKKLQNQRVNFILYALIKFKLPYSIKGYIDKELSFRRYEPKDMDEYNTIALLINPNLYFPSISDGYQTANISCNANINTRDRSIKEILNKWKVHFVKTIPNKFYNPFIHSSKEKELHIPI